MVLQLKNLFDRAGEKQSFEYDLAAVASAARSRASAGKTGSYHRYGGKQNGYSYFRLPGHVYAKYAVRPLSYPR